jgi:hypothetical protein
MTPLTLVGIALYIVCKALGARVIGSIFKWTAIGGACLGVLGLGICGWIHILATAGPVAGMLMVIAWILIVK